VYFIEENEEQYSSYRLGLSEKLSGYISPEVDLRVDLGKASIK